MQAPLIDWLQQNPPLDGFLVSKPENILYLSGFSGSFGYFLVRKNGERHLISDGRYAEVATKLSVKNDFMFVGYDADFSQKFGSQVAGKIAVENTLSLADFEKIKTLFPHITPQPQTGVIENIRRVKTLTEIQTIQAAQSHVDQCLIPFLKTHLRLGISERALNFRLQQTLQAEGRFGLSFPSIIAFGENSSRPHHVSGERQLKSGDNILVDCGVTKDGYASDMTRNFVFGVADPAYCAHYQNLLEAQQKTQTKITAGASTRAIDAFCRKTLDENAQYFTHSLGHGVGLEIHELPNLSPRQDYTLQAGEVVTNEPGIYFPGQYGIRIEDLLVVTDGVPKVLSQSPKDLLSFAEDGPVQILVQS